MRSGAIVLAAGIAALFAQNVFGQGYPDKPIRLVVTYPPGGVTDILARIVGPKMTEVLKQPVVIENRGGAGGTIGANLVAQSAADGYTLVMAVGGHAMAPNLYAKLPYDLVRDFAPVSQMVRTVYMLVVHPSVPAKSVKELIALAKSRPGKLNYASAGVGNLGHLSAEMFSSMAGIQMTHVAYKGDSPALAELIGGQVDLGFFATSVAAPYLKTGRLRALAVTTAQRTPLMPDVPTIAEAGGLAGYDVSSWMGISAPSRTPPEVVNKLNDTIVAIFATPEMRERLATMGFEPATNKPDEFASFIKVEVEKFSKLSKAAGIKPE